MSLSDPLLDSLTSAQREAVQHLDGPLLILAGPGSGKTRVVTHRIAHLLRQDVPAGQIVSLTFTNKAADEMRTRVEALAPQQSVWMSTFHRFAARLLRTHAPLVGLDENFTIYDADDSRQVVRRVLEDMNIDRTHVTPERISGAISWSKNRLVAADQFQPRSGKPVDHIVAQAYPEYQARLLASSAVDFDDLLLHLATLLQSNPELRATLDDRFRYVLVDEYQDTNLAQYAILRALSADYPNLAVTGDPDQSIYGWRGANLSNILEFEADFPDVHVVRLEQNWRSTKRIVRVASHLISYNRRRKEKKLTTENAEGSAVRLVAYSSQRDEAESIAAQMAGLMRSGHRRPGDFAIFYRINALSRTLEFALRDQGIPYQLVRGVEFYQRKEIKDVLAYAQLINNSRDDLALERIVNTPPRGIGKKTVDRVRMYSQRRGLSLLDAARESGLITELPKRSAVKVAKFVAMIDRLAILARASVEEILGHLLAETGYRDLFEASDLELDQNRLANIEELLTAARQFDEQNPGEGHLEAFLEQTCLVNDSDDWEEQADKVTLMTLHAAKGLEFPVVFIVAVEDGLLPHERSRRDKEELEEERRLLFVGMTRAEEELALSFAVYREFRGQRRTTVPSGFLMELPRHEMDVVEAPWSAPPIPVREPQLSRETVQTVQHAASPALTTAAQLAGESPTVSPTVSPDVFAQGMTVIHPNYGPGKIMALFGSGPNRRATVTFATAGQKKFVLASSPLRPVR